jgi:hypothetical protein
MATVNDVEATIGGWYKNVPHLPKSGQKWLADNVWWLAAIGAVLSVLGLIAIIPIIFTVLTVGSYVAMTSMYVPSVATYGGIFWLSIIISLASFVVTTILLLSSISPLKAQVKRGWRLLFLSYLVNFILSVVGALVSLAPFSVVGALVSAAIGGYFLFEIRPSFVTKHKVAAKADKK